jgi:hypothetical protein
MRVFGVNELQSGIGRNITFRAHHIPANPVLVFSYSTSLMKSEDIYLKPLSIHGSEGLERSINAAGIGMCKISVPVSDQHVFKLSTGREPEYFPQSNTPIQSLWGAKIRVDPRKIVGFMRELRIVNQVDLPTPPSSIQSFPADLLKAGLFFFGICEDGWMSTECELTLSGTEPLEIHGEIPFMGKGVLQNIRVLIDGEIATTSNYAAGNFSIKYSGKLIPGKHKISILNTNLLRLPWPDGRPVSLRIHTIQLKK